MNTNQNHAANLSIAYLLLRLSLGIVIFLHGVVRLAGHYQQFVKVPYSLSRRRLYLPAPFTLQRCAFLLLKPFSAFSYSTGLLTRLALMGGALLMILLLFGKSMQQDWTTVAIQLVYSFLYFVLLAYRGWNRFALDSVFRRKAK